MPSDVADGCPSTPIIWGMLGPVMSASRRPTVAPSSASEVARLTETLLLPTPPLPDATAMMFFTPGTRFSCCCWPGVAFRTDAPQVMSTSVAPSSLTWVSTSPPIWSLSGQAGVVRSIFNATAVPSMWISLTMSRLTMSRCSSGSWTFRRASVMVVSLSMPISYLPSRDWPLDAHSRNPAGESRRRDPYESRRRCCSTRAAWARVETDASARRRTTP